MTRVVIAPRRVALALAALGVLAAGGIALGAMLALGAGRVAAITHGTAAEYRLGGAIVLAVAGAALVWVARQWSAVRAFEVTGERWDAVDQLGRRTRLPDEVPVVFELRARRVVWTFGSAPRVQDVVDGHLRCGAIRRRLAPSGPTTYDAVLRELGFSAAAPRRGRASYERRRSA